MSPGDRLAQWLLPFPYFRGRFRLLDALVPRTGTRSATIFGYRMELDLAEMVPRWIYFGAYEVRERRWVEQYLRPGMTAVDAGANIGYFTALFSRAVGKQGRVLAFEPSPELYSRLQAMIAANPMPQARAFPFGLGEADGETTLYIPPASSGNNDPSMVRYTEGMTEVRVPVRSLDSLAAEQGWSAIDLLKLDVEGHEPRVLRGASRLLQAGRIRALLCEFNDPLLQRAGSSAAALYRELRDLGFVDAGGPPPARPVFTRFLRRTE
jgi:FkbM family methyltransferase